MTDHAHTPAPDEKELVARARAGEERALDMLVERHHAAAFRVALRIVGDEELAADAAQDAFIRAFRGLDRFRGDAAFRTWLYAITANEARGTEGTQGRPMSETRETRMDEERIRDLLPDFVAGRLDAGTSRRVEEAVAADSALAEEVDFLRGLLAARPPAPGGLEARIVAAVRREVPREVPQVRRPTIRLAVGWGLAAAAAAVLAFGTTEIMERWMIPPDPGSVGPMERIALDPSVEARGPGDPMVAGAPLLDDLTDDALVSLLEEMGG